MAGCTPKTVLWFSTASSDGIEVSVWKVGETFTFGQQNLSIRVGKQEVYQTYIANDGKNLFDENYSAIWESSSLLVLIFKGEEQENEEIRIRFEGNHINVDSSRQTN